MLIRGIMLLVLFSIVLGLPSLLFVYNYIYKRQIKRDSAVISDMKKAIRRIGLCDYWDFRFWDHD
jgi:uncharacterized ion transporter superfamily protein YfcC